MDKDRALSFLVGSVSKMLKAYHDAAAEQMGIDPEIVRGNTPLDEETAAEMGLDPRMVRANRAADQRQRAARRAYYGEGIRRYATNRLTDHIVWSLSSKKHNIYNRALYSQYYNIHGTVNKLTDALVKKFAPEFHHKNPNGSDYKNDNPFMYFRHSRARARQQAKQAGEKEEIKKQKKKAQAAKKEAERRERERNARQAEESQRQAETEARTERDADRQRRQEARAAREAQAATRGEAYRQQASEETTPPDAARVPTAAPETAAGPADSSAPASPPTPPVTLDGEFSERSTEIGAATPNPSFPASTAATENFLLPPPEEIAAAAQSRPGKNPSTPKPAKKGNIRPAKHRNRFKRRLSKFYAQKFQTPASDATHTVSMLDQARMLPVPYQSPHVMAGPTEHGNHSLLSDAANIAMLAIPGVGEAGVAARFAEMVATKYEMQAAERRALEEMGNHVEQGVRNRGRKTKPRQTPKQKDLNKRTRELLTNGVGAAHQNETPPPGDDTTPSGTSFASGGQATGDASMSSGSIDNLHDQQQRTVDNQTLHASHEIVELLRHNNDLLLQLIEAVGGGGWHGIGADGSFGGGRDGGPLAKNGHFPMVPFGGAGAGAGAGEAAGSGFLGALGGIAVTAVAGLVGAVTAPLFHDLLGKMLDGPGGKDLNGGSTGDKLVRRFRESMPDWMKKHLNLYGYDDQHQKVPLHGTPDWYKLHPKDQSDRPHGAYTGAGGPDTTTSVQQMAGGAAQPGAVEKLLSDAQTSAIDQVAPAIATPTVKDMANQIAAEHGGNAADVHFTARHVPLGPQTAWLETAPAASGNATAAQTVPSLSGAVIGKPGQPPHAELLGQGPRGYADKTGQQHWSPAVNQAIDQAARENGIDPLTMRTFAQIESAGNAHALNGKTHAAGLFQFMPGTQGRFGLNAQTAMDPLANARAAAHYMQANAKLMQKHGIAVTGANLYLAHQQGEGNFIHLMEYVQGKRKTLTPGMLKAMKNNPVPRDDGKKGWAYQGTDPSAFMTAWQRHYAAVQTKLNGGKKEQAVQQAATPAATQQAIQKTPQAAPSATPAKSAAKATAALQKAPSVAATASGTASGIYESVAQGDTEGLWNAPQMTQADAGDVAQSIAAGDSADGIGVIGNRVVDRTVQAGQFWKGVGASVYSGGQAIANSAAHAVKNVMPSHGHGAMVTPQYDGDLGGMAKGNAQVAANRKAYMLQTLKANGITDPREVAAFMANADIETGGFHHMLEGDGKAQGNPNYSKNANGVSFYGRGYVQLTGKANYKALSKLTGLDLVNHPELAADPKNAAKIGVAYWRMNGFDKLAKEGKFEKLTYKLTGHGQAMAKRQEKYQQYLADANAGKLNPGEVKLADAQESNGGVSLISEAKADTMQPSSPEADAANTAAMAQAQDKPGEADNRSLVQKALDAAKSTAQAGAAATSKAIPYVANAVTGGDAARSATMQAEMNKAVQQGLANMDMTPHTYGHGPLLSTRGGPTAPVSGRFGAQWMAATGTPQVGPVSPVQSANVLSNLSAQLSGAGASQQVNPLGSLTRMATSPYSTLGHPAIQLASEHRNVLNNFTNSLNTFSAETAHPTDAARQTISSLLQAEPAFRPNGGGGGGGEGVASGDSGALSGQGGAFGGNVGVGAQQQIAADGPISAISPTGAVSAINPSDQEQRPDHGPDMDQIMYNSNHNSSSVSTINNSVVQDSSQTNETNKAPVDISSVGVLLFNTSML